MTRDFQVTILSSSWRQGQNLVVAYFILQEYYTFSDFESGHKEAALKTLASLLAPFQHDNQSLHRAIEAQDKYAFLPPPLSYRLWRTDQDCAGKQ